MNVLTLCDWHVPYHDVQAVEAALGFAKKLQPSIIVLHEMHDFYALSKFDKNPERRFRLQEEIDEVNGYMRRIKGICPNSRLILLESNHLDRLRRYLWRQAPELASLRNLQVEKLLELDELGIEYMREFEYDGFLWKHGKKVMKDSGLSARAELAAEWTSGCSGHTHRLGQIYQRKYDGMHTWLEAGCLCSLDPEYVKRPDWQHGAVLTTFGDKYWWATLIPLVFGEIPDGIWKLAA